MRPLGAAHNVTVKTQVPPPGILRYKLLQVPHCFKFRGRNCRCARENFYPLSNESQRDNTKEIILSFEV